MLFLLDVGVRRIQLDREQWEKAFATIKRTVLFWRTMPRPATGDESLAALLARRDQVRAKQGAVASETRPELFSPQRVAELPESPGETAFPAPKRPSEASAGRSGSPEEEPATTTSRLLQAKRKAQRKKN
jgi:hypothetical protein